MFTSFLNKVFAMPQQSPLILVDGSSYLYRAFHALPPLVNSAGVATGAIYGVIAMLKRLIADYHPKHMAVVFDAKGVTFRDALFAAYKATRKAMPEALVEQIVPLHQLIQALGIPLLMIEGVEADDVIGTLAQANTAKGGATLISTSDKDLAQLVNDHVTLINTMTRTVLDEAGVKTKFGVLPSQMIDYLTLVGDTSDNIPGVPKVGEKTAIKWLQHYGSLDGILQHADDITGKVGASLREFIPTQLPITRQLVTIHCDVPLPVAIDELKLGTADTAALIAIYKKLEFKKWLGEIDEKQDAPGQVIHDQAELEKIIAEINQHDLLAMSVKTTSEDYMSAKLVEIGLALAEDKAFHIPWQESVLSVLKPILENSAIKKISQNLKYDMEVFANHGVVFNGLYFDTMLAAFLLEGKKQQTANPMADVVFKSYTHFQSLFEKEKGPRHVFDEIEMPLIPILAEMELTGVLIDPAKLAHEEKMLQKRMQKLEEDAYCLAGEEFNLSSPKQLQAILYDKLKLPASKKTPTGQPSTADMVLQELAQHFDIANVIIEYRRLSKLVSTYTSRLIEQINPTTGRVHTSYNQIGASTGRMSSSHPNLQNIPIRTEEGKRIRQAFIAKKEFKLISADYSQIELRLVAHITEDPKLLTAFENNVDIHQATAAEILGVPLDQVTSDMRRHAKAINFGILYGMSAFGLTQQLGISREAAQEYIDNYFVRYTRVRDYLDHVREFAKQKGWVETIFGRKLIIPDIHATQMMRQKAAERAAINAPLQGSAADIIKLAMIKVDHWLKTTKINAKMIMQVHDELVFEVHEKDEAAAIAGIEKNMSGAAQLKVPLVVSVGVGDNWDEASEAR